MHQRWTTRSISRIGALVPNNPNAALIGLGVLAFAAMLLYATTQARLAPPARAAAQDCVQPSPEGCEIGLGEWVTAVQPEAGITHLWWIDVPGPGDLIIELSGASVPYELVVWGPDDSTLAYILGPEADPLVVTAPASRAGWYSVTLANVGEQTSEAPYGLTVLRGVAPLPMETPQPLPTPPPLPTPLPVSPYDMPPSTPFNPYPPVP